MQTIIIDIKEKSRFTDDCYETFNHQVGELIEKKNPKIDADLNMLVAFDKKVTDSTRFTNRFHFFESDVHPIKTVDLKGLYCPEPLMMLRPIVRKSNGEYLEVLTTDPATERDIPAFCYHMDHTLISHQKNENGYQFIIKIGVH